MRSLRSLTLLLAAALALGACESSTGSEPSIEETEFASSLGVDLAASTKTASGLYYRDLAVGTGAVVQAGTRANVRYVGYFANGTVFDQRTAAQSPFSFTVGAGQVIEGWDEGVVGMKVGGRRQLIIPPSLGYGSQDYGPIPGNSILVFTVEVVSIG
ncbi:MAG TPA: FKBP-type peptidyl-prolyl cis-trans isomerase [Longimicrobium sp.]|nr:FKBP-type peptidyl-prolyl cis-trans isomerase [Longimicrobium sp.]